MRNKIDLYMELVTRLDTYTIYMPLRQYVFHQITLNI